MSQIATELLFILLLLLVNGLLAMTEMAVVSARKARLKRLVDQGDQRARDALALAESPNRFLSTVQIGITLLKGNWICGVEGSWVGGGRGLGEGGATGIRNRPP